MIVMKMSEIDKNFKVESKLNKENIKFYNAEEAPFKIYGVFREEDRFVRLPGAVSRKVSEGVYALHAHTAGGRVRFKTDSREIAIFAVMQNPYKVPHFSLTGTASFDLYAGDKYSGIFIPPYDMKDGYESIVGLEKGGMKDITINFPNYSEVKELYIGLDEDAEVDLPDPYINKKPVVYYGSSITQGACASRPGMAYQNIISRSSNLDFVNLGFAGNAKAEPEMAEYISDLDMSVFVYDYDHNAPNAEYLRDTHERMFLTVREKNPDIPIILMSRPKHDLYDGEKERLKVIRTTYENALSRGDKNVFFADGPSLMSLCGDEGRVDASHPNDLGFFSMAKVLGDLMEKEILSGKYKL